MTLIRIKINYVCPPLDKIEHREPPTKFSALNCPDYQGIKDPVTRILHFKMTMVPIDLTQDKRDFMICKLFATTLFDGARGGSTTWHLVLLLLSHDFPICSPKITKVSSI